MRDILEARLDDYAAAACLSDLNATLDSVEAIGGLMQNVLIKARQLSEHKERADRNGSYSIVGLYDWWSGDLKKVEMDHVQSMTIRKDLSALIHAPLGEPQRKLRHTWMA